MRIAFSQAIKNMLYYFLHVQKLWRAAMAGFTKKVKKKVMRLLSPSATHVSLVGSGANKNPFLVEQSSVAAVPNYTPKGANNSAFSTNIAAIRLYSDSGDIKLTKNLLSAVESQLGIDLSEAAVQVDQGLVVSLLDASEDYVEVADVELKGTDIKMSFSLIHEICQSAEEDSLESDECDIVEEATAELIEEVQMIAEETKDEVLVEVAQGEAVEEVAQEAAPEAPQEVESVVAEEAAPVEEVEQAVDPMASVMKEMLAAITSLTAQVGELKAARASEVVDQGVKEQAEEVIVRTMPSTSGSTVVAEVEQSAHRSHGLPAMSPEERHSYLRKFM